MSETKAALQADIKDAMKAREKELLTTLRGISAAIKQIEIDTREELSEEGVLSVLQKEQKKRKDSMKFAEEAGREDLLAQNKAEIKIIQKYLGEEMSEDKLRAEISKLIEAGANQIGAIMGGLNREHKGKFDGRMASELAKELLS